MIHVAHIFAGTRAAGPGWRMAIQLGGVGDPSVSPVTLVARGRRLGVQGFTVLGVDHPEDVAAVTALAQAAAPTPLAWAGALDPGAVTALGTNATPLGQSPAPTVELRPGLHRTWVLGLDTAGALARLEGAPLHERARIEGADAERLRFLEGLLGGRPWTPEPVAPAGGAPVSASLLEAGGLRIARASLRWLLDAGGRRPRTVVRGGVRRRGRLWDPALRGDLSLRFAATTTRLWTEGPAQLATLGDHSARVMARQVRRWLPTGTRPGDWIFLALAWPRLAEIVGPTDLRGALRRRLAVASPLLALLEAEASRPDRLALLLTSEAVRLPECASDALAAAWSRAMARAAAIELGRSDGAGYGDLAQVLGAWLDTLEAHHRLDLCDPVLRAMADLPTQASAAAVLGQLPPRHLEGGATREAAGRLYALGDRLRRTRQAMAQVRYGDERHAEAQRYLADYDALYAPSAALVEREWRRVAGIIG